MFDRKRKTREHSLENAFKRVSSSVKEMSKKRKEKRLSKRRKRRRRRRKNSSNKRNFLISPCHNTYSTNIRMKIKKEK